MLTSVTVLGISSGSGDGPASVSEDCQWRCRAHRGPSCSRQRSLSWSRLLQSSSAFWKGLLIQKNCDMCMQSTAGSLQSLCWASAALGGVASAYFSGSLIETWGPRGVFLLTAAFPLVVSLAAVLISEQPVGSGGSRLKADKDTASECAHPRVTLQNCLTLHETLLCIVTLAQMRRYWAAEDHV